jgi:hypothetical protein
MAQFGDKAYMLLMNGKKLAGIAGWQVENLVVRRRMSTWNSAWTWQRPWRR